MVSLDVALYWTSLAVSAAGVVVFLWLMREKPDRSREAGDGRGKTNETRNG